MPTVNNENIANSRQIYTLLKSNFKAVDNLDVIDFCCGVFDPAGVNYDPKGDIYQPIVAQYLGQKGLKVTGVDFRQNDPNSKLNYLHRKDINILDSNWTSKINLKYDVVIFLRSWDTPEIILDYQKRTNISDINTLSLIIAQDLIPKFVKLLKPNGLFITTDIFNLSLFNSGVEANEFEGKLDLLLKSQHLDLVFSSNGLYGYKIK